MKREEVRRCEPHITSQPSPNLKAGLISITLASFPLVRDYKVFWQSYNFFYMQMSAKIKTDFSASLLII